MNPTNYQISDNQTAVAQISHPYSQSPNTGNLAYQHLFDQPNIFNAYHFNDQSPVMFTPFESGIPQLASGGDPQIYTSAQLFALPSASVPSIPTHLSGQHLPSQTNGQLGSNQPLSTPSSSQSQLSHHYPGQTTQSGLRVPETSTKVNPIIVSKMKPQIGNDKSDSGQTASNQRAKGNRPGRAGTLKCARCRKQKRGRKVRAIRIVRLT